MLSLEVGRDPILGGFWQRIAVHSLGVRQEILNQKRAGGVDLKGFFFAGQGGCNQVVT